MKKPTGCEVAFYATCFLGLAAYLGSEIANEKENAIKSTQQAKFWCYGDYVGVLGQFKDNWYATENKTRTVNGERVKLKENERVDLDYKQCTFSYKLDAKYGLPVGLIRKTQEGLTAKVVGGEAVGRGFRLTINVGDGNVKMAQSSFLKQYPYFVSW